MLEVDQIIKQDSQFLYKNRLIDYSLLLVVETVKLDCMDVINSSEVGPLHSLTDTRNRFISPRREITVNGKTVAYQQVYHIGIIDYLQAWNTTKKVERCFKGALNMKDAHMLSVAHPRIYQRRFYEFMKNNVVKDECSSFHSNFMQELLAEIVNREGPK